MGIIHQYNQILQNIPGEDIFSVTSFYINFFLVSQISVDFSRWRYFLGDFILYKVLRTGPQGAHLSIAFVIKTSF